MRQRASSRLTFTGPYFGKASKEVCDLRGLHERGRVGQQLVDRATARLEVALELRALAAHRVGAAKRILALRERSRRRPPVCCGFIVVWPSDPPTLPTNTRCVAGSAA